VREAAEEETIHASPDLAEQTGSRAAAVDDLALDQQLLIGKPLLHGSANKRDVLDRGGPHCSDRPLRFVRGDDAGSGLRRVAERRYQLPDADAGCLGR